jgi:hypothetical protein
MQVFGTSKNTHKQIANVSQGLSRKKKLTRCIFTLDNKWQSRTLYKLDLSVPSEMHKRHHIWVDYISQRKQSLEFGRISETWPIDKDNVF